MGWNRLAEGAACYCYYLYILISSENISCINLILYIIQTSILAVGNDGMALCLEGIQVIDNLAAEEGAAIFECWLIYDYLNMGCIEIVLYGVIVGRCCNHNEVSILICRQ